jgi:uroporphyrinogen-III synthase
MRVWVTRAQPGAAATARRLAALGHQAFVSPLLTVEPVDGPIELHGVGALAFTSANGVAAFAAREPGRGLPVFAVGDATARAAREAGFRRTLSAEGDVAALAQLIIKSRGSFTGAVLHPGAEALAGDLKGALNAAGVAAHTVVVYRSVPAVPSDETVAALDELDAILVHSPAAAALLARIDAARPLLVCCISNAAAAPLNARGFRRVAVPPSPDEAALLELLAGKDC